MSIKSMACHVLAMGGNPDKDSEMNDHPPQSVYDWVWRTFDWPHLTKAVTQKTLQPHWWFSRCCIPRAGNYFCWC